MSEGVRVGVVDNAIGEGGNLETPKAGTGEG